MLKVESTLVFQLLESLKVQRFQAVGFKLTHTCTPYSSAHCVEEIDAQKVYGYAMFKDGEAAQVGYPLEDHGDDVAGRSFHNGR